MTPLLALLRRLSDARGQTMTEYAILIAWIVLLVIVGASAVGHVLSNVLSSTASRV